MFKLLNNCIITSGVIGFFFSIGRLNFLFEASTIFLITSEIQGSYAVKITFDRTKVVRRFH
jgi:hypothetical protein